MRILSSSTRTTIGGSCAREPRFDPAAPGARGSQGPGARSRVPSPGTILRPRPNAPAVATISVPAGSRGASRRAKRRRGGAAVRGQRDHAAARGCLRTRGPSCNSPGSLPALRRQLVDTVGAHERVLADGLPPSGAQPATIPACGPPRSLSALKQTRSDTRFEALARKRLVPDAVRSQVDQAAAADVFHQRHAAPPRKRDHLVRARVAP